MNIIFHIDVNNAFLSWSAIYLLKNGYDTDIRKIPSCIAGDEDKRHGIVLAKSDISKKYKIKTGETLHNARLKCKDLKVFKPNFFFYREMSDKLYEYFKTITPDVERYSIDECFLDLTNTNFLYDDILELAYRIKNEIKEKFSFTVNIGIGNNKLCAKMAGDFEKPDRVHTLFKEEIETKMWPLPIEDLLYVGKSTSQELRKMGINTIGQLANYDLELLKKHFKNQAIFMKEYANGKDDSKVITKYPQKKSISLSRTLEYDTNNLEYLKKVISLMVNRIGMELRQKKLYAKTIAITLKTNDFEAYSHQKKLVNETNNTMNLLTAALELLDIILGDKIIRNIGIRVSDLSEYKNNQISLFENINKNLDDDKIQTVVDNLNFKYDSLKIMPAVFYKNDDGI